jgi:hypothetical protein
MSGSTRVPSLCRPDAGAAAGLRKVELDVNLTQRRPRLRQAVKQLTVEATRFDLEILSGGAVDDADGDAGAGDAVAELAGEVRLDLLSREAAHPRQEGLDVQGGAAALEELPGGADREVRGVLDEVQPLSLAVGRAGGEGELLPDGPEAQQADAELALDAVASLLLEPALDRVADVGWRRSESR